MGSDYFAWHALWGLGLIGFTISTRIDIEIPGQGPDIQGGSIPRPPGGGGGSRKYDPSPQGGLYASIGFGALGV